MTALIVPIGSIRSLSLKAISMRSTPVELAFLRMMPALPLLLLRLKINDLTTLLASTMSAMIKAPTSD
jgi:hypothetical protein